MQSVRRPPRRYRAHQDERRVKRPRRVRALLRLPGLVLGAILLPLRRRKKARGISGDPGVRRDEMLALTADVTRTVGIARLRSLFRSKKKKAELRRAALERATSLTVEQLGNMKGLSMKVGQIISYFSVLSEEGEEQMAQLQDAVPPMDPELVRAVLEDQFGDATETIFDSFEMEPIAAASVGQVHRARLHDGRVVAVKIQYPGVSDAFAADLDNLRSLTNLAPLYMKADVTEYFTLIADSLMGELDYSAEQRHQQRLADLYRNHRYVLIPDTVPELCRPKALVSQFIEGERFMQAAKTRGQEERNRIGEVMYRFAFGCILNGFFSGDPHPGNYLYPTDGRVCFLDFGMVMDISGSDHAGKISQVLAAALDGRQDLIDDGLRTLGFLPEGGPTGAEVWDEMRDLIVGPIDVDGMTRLDRRAFRKAVLKLMNPRAKWNQASMKTERFEGWAAIWMRYAIGGLSAISKFAPEADWRHIVAEIVLGHPPRTEIGKNWGPSPGSAEFAGSRFGGV